MPKGLHSFVSPHSAMFHLSNSVKIHHLPRGRAPPHIEYLDCIVHANSHQLINEMSAPFICKKVTSNEFLYRERVKIKEIHRTSMREIDFILLIVVHCRHTSNYGGPYVMVISLSSAEKRYTGIRTTCMGVCPTIC